MQMALLLEEAVSNIKTLNYQNNGIKIVLKLLKQIKYILTVNKY